MGPPAFRTGDGQAFHVYTGAKSGDWAMLCSIMRRLGPTDEATTDAAVALATAKGWIEDRGGSSIRLTDDGRLSAQGSLRR